MGFFSQLKEDVQNVFHKDPAARNVLEVVLLYPGLHALWSYRLAHFFWRHNWCFVARFISEVSRVFTGIEIHPGARIGRRFFIDHGMGVVIGETAEIGDDVLLYQGVVLGGTSLERKKRHPSIGNNVVVGSAAILLGPITVGDSARVGANSVVVKSVPPGVTVVGVPGRVVEDNRSEEAALEHGKLPDPFAMVINLLIAEHSVMEQRVKVIEERIGVPAGSEHTLDEKLSAAQSLFADGGGI